MVASSLRSALDYQVRVRDRDDDSFGLSREFIISNAAYCGYRVTQPAEATPGIAPRATPCAGIGPAPARRRSTCTSCGRASRSRSSLTRPATTGPSPGPCPRMRRSAETTGFGFATAATGTPTTPRTSSRSRKEPQCSYQVDEPRQAPHGGWVRRTTSCGRARRAAGRPSTSTCCWPARGWPPSSPTLRMRHLLVDRSERSRGCRRLPGAGRRCDGHGALRRVAAVPNRGGGRTTEERV